MCVCVCVCVRERERERERVCVCVRERDATKKKGGDRKVTGSSICIVMVIMGCEHPAFFDSVFF